MVNPAESGKDRLKLATPALKDIVLRTTTSYRRTLPADTQIIDLGNLEEEARNLKAVATEKSSNVTSIIIANHQNRKLSISQPLIAEDNRVQMSLDIRVNLLGLFLDRGFRQDKSGDLIISTARNDLEITPMIAKLLLDDEVILSPAGVMVVADEGYHLFFRSLDTIVQTAQENKALIDHSKGMSMKDFAKLYQLRYFYCPNGATTATPVLM